MPIYEYKCASCDGNFEKMVKMDAPAPACPKCGAADDVRKMVSASSFVLKGAGWYKDHYGLKSSGGGSGEGSSGGSSGEGSSGGGSGEGGSSSSSSGGGDT